MSEQEAAGRADAPAEPFPSPPRRNRRARAHRRSSHRARLRIGLGLAALCVAGAAGALVYEAATGATTEHGDGRSAGAADGRLVFQDSFVAPDGWPTAPLPSGTRFSYAGGAYVIDGRGNLDHFAFSPDRAPLSQLSAEIVASRQPPDRPGSGFGVLCVLPSDRLRFEFLLESGSRWLIEEASGLPAGPGTSAPHRLASGAAPASPAGAPSAVAGSCRTEAGGQATRLTMFVDGTRVAELRAPSPGAAAGWLTGIDVASRAGSPVAVTVLYFGERDAAA